jgi:Protein of unknown function (DUF667)
MAAATQLLALIPPGESSTVAEAPGLLSLMETAKRAREAPHKPDPTAHASVLSDGDLFGALVLEFVGRDLQLTLPCRTSLPILTLHICDIGKFFDIELALVDAVGNLKHVLLTNRVNCVRTGAEEAALPLSITPHSWSLLRLDLRSIMDAAFGKEYALCAGIVVHASCRLARVFFTDKECADDELPPFLRVLPPPGT